MADSHEQFLDLLGATNLIPGPNSTEMAIHLGRQGAGWPGLVVAGTAFILPAFFMVWALAAAYDRFQARHRLPACLLDGIKPVLIAVILAGAVPSPWRARTAAKIAASSRSSPWAASA